MGMKVNPEQKYKLLIYNYLSRRTSPEDERSLLEWLQQSDTHIKLFSDYKKIVCLTAGLYCKGHTQFLRSGNPEQMRLQKSPYMKTLKQFLTIQLTMNTN